MSSLPLHVVYVSGAPRSGTTLLSMSLGQLPDAIEIGELWALWGPAFAERDECGCGIAVPDCPLWSQVVRRVFGDQFRSRGPEMGALHDRHLGTLRAPRTWWQTRGRTPSPAYGQYASDLAEHYRAIAEVSGNHIIVDSSKMAADVLVAGTIAGIKVSVVHMVRDPRGVAWSWRKQVRQSGQDGRPFAQRSWASSAARWLTYNVFAELLLRQRFSTRFRVMRYEDFMADPAALVDELAEWIGVLPGTTPITGSPATLALDRPRHPVWGNPLRAAVGDLVICEDDAWRTQLDRPSRVMTTLATLPLLHRYRYPLTGGAPSFSTINREQHRVDP